MKVPADRIGGESSKGSPHPWRDFSIIRGNFWKLKRL